MMPTKFLIGLLILVSGQCPKEYLALHAGQLAGAASALWQHVRSNMDMKKTTTEGIVNSG
jgi:hypothetical protein